MPNGRGQFRPIAMRSMASTVKRYVTQSGLVGPVKVGLPAGFTHEISHANLG
jgi:hypothetical protein